MIFAPASFFEQYREATVNAAYLASAVLFVLGLKGLAHPRTAVRGNLIGAAGMLVAVIVTLLDRRVIRFEWILAGIAIGSLLGILLAAKIHMTAMPQLVAVFNGFGGAASALVASASLLETGASARGFDPRFTASATASAFIGTVTFMGSMVAFSKLQRVLVPSEGVTHPFVKAVTVLFSLVAIAGTILVIGSPPSWPWYGALVGASAVLGVSLVLPIGGADMPVVIALLNSYSGLAAAATGFVLNNNVLIIAGSLVGASGLILTRVMCKAMNRSLSNVLFGGFGVSAGEASKGPATGYEGRVKSLSVEEAAMVLDGARKVVIVPGYGMAVAQAQHAIRDLASYLGSRDVEVMFAIHPVAGRMPGHMNVLLAEADIPYEQLFELDAMNPLFPDIDVALVVGANDVVNPSARDDPNSPIAGMPILNVDKARSVIVVKRSLAPGFAGIANPLFGEDNAMMLFGDAKQMIVELVKTLKNA